MPAHELTKRDFDEVIQIIDKLIGRNYTGYGIDLARNAPMLRIRALCKQCGRSDTRVEVSAEQNLRSEGWGSLIIENLVDQAKQHTKMHHPETSNIIPPGFSPGSLWKPDYRGANLLGPNNG